MPRWTRQDKNAVRDILDQVAAKVGGQAEVARALTLADRRNVNNWRARGLIPLDEHPAFIALAAKQGIAVKPSDLHPRSRAAVLLEAGCATPTEKTQTTAP